MSKEFEKLCQLIQITDPDFIHQGHVESVLVDSKTHDWTFKIRFHSMPDIEAFKTFHEGLLMLHHQLDHAKNIHVSYQFDSTNPTLFLSYFNYILLLLSIEKPRYESLHQMALSQEGNDIIIEVPEDATYTPMWQESIESIVHRFGLKIPFIFKKRKDHSIQKRIEETIQKESQEVMVQAPESYLVYNGEVIDKITHTISDIPITEEKLSEYTSAHRNARFVFEGEIFSVDERKLRNNLTLMTWVIGDAKDAIYVKKFIKDSQELSWMSQASMHHKVKIDGNAHYDKFSQEVVITAQIVNVTKHPVVLDLRDDKASKKRIEFHLHTKMSALDGVDSIEDYVDTIKRWKHPALAVTDHDNVQVFPAFHKALKNTPIKPIYGAELSVYYASNLDIYRGHHTGDLMDQTFVVFDIETTGLSVIEDEIIEISAIKIKAQQTIDRFDTFIQSSSPLKRFTKELTSITDQDLKNAPSKEQALSAFKTFIGDAILVAHNAFFDVDFLTYHLQQVGFSDVHYSVIDTLQIARQIYGHKLKRFNLKAVSKFFNVELTQHHRAEADTFATSEIFKSMLAQIYGKGFKTLNELKHISRNHEDGLAVRHARKSHITVWVKNQVGLKHLYQLISLSHTKYYNEGPALPFNEVLKFREGLLISTGCMHSDFIETAFNKPDSHIDALIQDYDVVELQPVEDYIHLFDRELEMDEPLDTVIQKIKAMINRVLKVASARDKIVIATSDAHHIEKESLKYRDIYIKTPIVGGGYHPLARNKKIPAQYLRTTEEMLESFDFLGDALSHQIVIDNPHRLNERIETVTPFPKDLYAPSDTFLAHEGIPSAVNALKQIVSENLEKKYGKNPHPYVKDRVDKELRSIIDNQFSSVYYISYLLVQKSLNEGYLVGSRGSVGSSFVATLMNITEVNPLAPHYVCESCHFFTFKRDEDNKTKYPIDSDETPFISYLENVESGFDLEALTCPHCDTPLTREGHDIPFETFLGFKGDKVPDIDLNFSGDYQAHIHEYVREIFGKDRAFRAGTISTVAARTAFGYVRGYIEKEDLHLRKAEIERRAQMISGVKRSTGQHPGGIVVVPRDKEITDVTPVQYPADDTSSSWQTTHFDYHSFESNLFKLDVLGHDDPTMIRMLMDYAKDNPIDFPFTDASDIPLNDPNVFKLLSGTDVIGLDEKTLGSPVASFGVPEMGTQFVRRMLQASHIKTFADIVKISGLSHGTDVWSNNAEMLVKGTHPDYPKVPFKDVIGCRDDIMINLINYGIQKEVAFELSEFIRRGKPSKDKEAWEGYKAIMKQHNIPEWYIWSCGQIKYMFPKAHATAYVMMALRIAWFKVYRPIYFYAAYFSIRAKDFDLISFMGGSSTIYQKMKYIEEKGMAASDTEKRLLTVLEVAYEMTLRGFHFEPINLLESDAKTFKITRDKMGLRLPFIVLDGMGLKVAESIVKAREEQWFNSQEDLKKRTLITKTSFDKLLALNALGDLPEDTQMQLFTL